MKQEKWKTLAIIFAVIIIIENLFILWGLSLNAEEEEKLNICYYDICSGFYDAVYSNEVCSCYDYDTLGYLVIEKTEYMG